jgi:hypothetical protein
MGLDLHIMPLALYLSEGAVPVAAQRIGTTPVRLGTSEAKASRDAAEASVRELQEKTGAWKEAGRTAWSERFSYRSFGVLRAYAAHRDHLAAGNAPPVDLDRLLASSEPWEHPALERIWKGAPTASPHLVNHADNCGYYLPVAFEKPLLLDEKNHVYAGSSPALLGELDRLAPLLGVSRDWEQLRDGESACVEGEPLGEVKFGWSILHAAARLSVRYGLPVVFDG